MTIVCIGKFLIANGQFIIFSIVFKCLETLMNDDGVCLYVVCVCYVCGVCVCACVCVLCVCVCVCVCVWLVLMLMLKA